MGDREDHEKYRLTEALCQLDQVDLALSRLEALTKGTAPPSNDSDVVEVAPFCSFCGKGHNVVRKMVAAPQVHICNECITLCEQLIRE